MSQMKPKEISAYVKGCFVGKVLVAETNEGICSILFGDDQFEMLDELRHIFPKDIITLKNGPSPNVIAKMIDEGTKNTNLQLDIRTGTELQQQIWAEIMKIPSGNTITYTELANKIGKPKSWRVVANSCAANVLAYVIPCHRVVSKNEEKHNYRWGSKRKQQLLKREADENISKTK